MSSRTRCIGGLAFVLACALSCLSLTGTGLASSGEAKPIITTPTPTPIPLAQLIASSNLQPTGRVTFLPFAVRAGRAAQDSITETFTYVVQPGDSLWSLALDFGRDLDTLSCATSPTGADAETIQAGQMITVPALSDLCYTVTPGDTLGGIAAAFGLPIQAIVDMAWNGFTEPPYVVVPRQRVLLPGARRSAPPRPDRVDSSRAADSWAGSNWPEWPYGDGHFVWPVVGPISQEAHEGHWAIDIAVPVGSPVQAADRGTVVLAGWNPSGYGFRVVVDHGNDYLTLYAHLSDIYVKKGQVVGKGQVIGASGANGNVTGPHLHFEIRDFGMLTDPMRLLTADEP